MGCCNSRLNVRHLDLVAYSFLQNETVATFSYNMKNDYEYYSSVVNSIDNNGMKYLSYICLYASHLLKYIIEKQTIEKCDMEHRDSRGRTFLHYLFMNEHTNTTDIQKLVNYKSAIVKIRIVKLNV